MVDKIIIMVDLQAKLLGVLALNKTKNLHPSTDLSFLSLLRNLCCEKETSLTYLCNKGSLQVSRQTKLMKVVDLKALLPYE